MKIVAITRPGTEYIYSVFSAHAVPVSSAQRIRSALNASGYRLKAGQTWHLYDVDKYDDAHAIAQQQRFSVRKGRLYSVEMYQY